MIIVANRTEKARMSGMNGEVDTGIKFKVAMLLIEVYILLLRVLPQLASVSASEIPMLDV